MFTMLVWDIVCDLFMQNNVKCNLSFHEGQYSSVLLEKAVTWFK